MMKRAFDWALLCAAVSVASACDSSSPSHHETQPMTDAAMTSPPAPEQDAGSHAMQATTGAAQPTTDAATTPSPGPEDDAGSVDGCWMIACRDGADIHASLAVSWSEAIASQVEVCHNGECYSGTWPTPGVETPGPGVIAFLKLPAHSDPPRETDPFIEVSLTWRDSAGPLLKVQWNPGTRSELNAGDRYRVTLTSSGHTLLAIDQRVDEYDIVSLLPAHCMQMCMHKTFEFDDKGHCTNCDAAGHTVDAGH